MKKYVDTPATWDFGMFSDEEEYQLRCWSCKHIKGQGGMFGKILSCAIGYNSDYGLEEKGCKGWEKCSIDDAHVSEEWYFRE